jgi:hypothetical protein
VNPDLETQRRKVTPEMQLRHSTSADPATIAGAIRWTVPARFDEKIASETLSLNHQVVRSFNAVFSTGCGTVMADVYRQKSGLMFHGDFL